MKWVLAGVTVIALIIIFSVNYSGEDCASLARSKYSGDNRFVETTYSQGDFVKGIVGEYVGGVERTAGHWECSTESGDPEITFYSRAN